MRKILVNYADLRYLRGQRRCARLGLVRGGFDSCLSYGRGDLDSDFVAENSILFKASRGAGYWLWKPYIIRDALRQANEGDVVVYADSGCFFTGPADELIQTCLDSTPGVLGIHLGVLREGQWTKRDAFILMGCDDEDTRRSTQFMSGVIVFTNNEFARAFVETWLTLALDPRLLTDLPNVCGVPNYPEFIAHRHDQSIFSLLYKRHGLASAQGLGVDVDKCLCFAQRDARWFEWLIPFSDRRWRKANRGRR